MTIHGDIEPVNGSLNKKRGKLNLTVAVWITAILVSAVIFAGSIFLADTLLGKFSGAILFGVFWLCAWILNLVPDKKLIRLWCASRFQAAHYDPGKAGR